MVKTHESSYLDPQIQCGCDWTRILPVMLGTKLDSERAVIGRAKGGVLACIVPLWVPRGSSRM